jgi:hypothetical protein
MTMKMTVKTSSGSPLRWGMSKASFYTQAYFVLHKGVDQFCLVLIFLHLGLADGGHFSA